MTSNSKLRKEIKILRLKHREEYAEFTEDEFEDMTWKEGELKGREEREKEIMKALKKWWNEHLYGVVEVKDWDNSSHTKWLRDNI